MTKENTHPTPQTNIPIEQLEELLCQAAEKGALRALADVGLEGKNAHQDVRELRSLLQAFRLAKRTALKTIVHALTVGFLAALMTGIAIKMRLFGESPPF